MKTKSRRIGERREPGARGPALSPWAWSLAVLTVCGASAVFQAVSDRRHAGEAAAAGAPPFPLGRLPRRLGGWEAADREIEVDARTLLISGCTGHVSRRYTDANTGVALTVLVGFGPADRVSGHTPEVCFPAFGYVPQGEPAERSVGAGPGAPTARLRSAVYATPGDAAGERIEVVYGFRRGGLWSHDGSAGRRRSRHEPGVFKVQVERRLAAGERGGPGGPSEAFLAALIPEIEAAVRAAGPAPRG